MYFFAAEFGHVVLLYSNLKAEQGKHHSIDIRGRHNDEVETTVMRAQNTYAQNSIITLGMKCLLFVYSSFLSI